jgi:hypothetical protein
MGLADDIRGRVHRRELPRARPPKIWSGFGDSTNCSACDEPIFHAHVRYELEVDDRAFHFHLGCFGLWDAELRRRGLDRSPSVDEGKLRLVREFLQREFRNCCHDDYFDGATPAQVFIIETARGFQRSLVIPQRTFEHPDFAFLCNARLAEALAEALPNGRGGPLTLTPEGLK